MVQLTQAQKQNLAQQEEAERRREEQLIKEGITQQEAKQLLEKGVDPETVERLAEGQITAEQAKRLARGARQTEEQRLERFRQQLQDELNRSVTKREARQIFQRRGELQRGRRQSLTEEALAKEAARRIEDIRAAERLEKQRKQSLTLDEAQDIQEEQELVREAQQTKKQTLTQRQRQRAIEQRQEKQFQVTLQSAQQAPEVQRQIRQQGGTITGQQLTGTGQFGTTQATIAFRATERPTIDTNQLQSARSIAAERRAQRAFRTQDPLQATATMGITAFQNPLETATDFIRTGTAFSPVLSVKIARGENPFAQTRELQREREVGNIESIIARRQRGQTTGQIVAGETLETASSTLVTGAGAGLATRGAIRGISGIRRAALSRSVSGRRLITGTQRFAQTEAGQITAGQVEAGAIGLVTVTEARRQGVRAGQLRQGQITSTEFAAGVVEDIGNIATFTQGFRAARPRLTEEVLLRQGRVELAPRRTQFTARTVRSELVRKPQLVTRPQQRIQRPLRASELEELRQAPVLRRQRTEAGIIETRGIKEGRELRFTQILRTSERDVGRVAQQEFGQVTQVGGFARQFEGAGAVRLPGGTGVQTFAGRAETLAPLRGRGTGLQPQQRLPSGFNQRITIGIRGVRRPRRTRRQTIPTQRLGTPGDTQPTILARGTGQPRPTFRQPTGTGLALPEAEQAGGFAFAPTRITRQFQTPQFTATGFTQRFTQGPRRAQQPTLRQEFRQPTGTQFNLQQTVTQDTRSQLLQGVAQFSPLRQRQPQRGRTRGGLRTGQKTTQTPRQRIGPQLRLRERFDFSIPRPTPQRPRPPTARPPAGILPRRRGRNIFERPTRRPTRRRKEKDGSVFERIFFSDPFSVAVSRARFGRATSPLNVPRVIEQARATAFLRVPTVEQRRSNKKNKNNRRLGGFI